MMMLIVGEFTAYADYLDAEHCRSVVEQHTSSEQGPNPAKYPSGMTIVLPFPTLLAALNFLLG